MLRISVVTPCYNMGSYLERTISSVLDNLRPKDEYFIIDGGSSDGSLEIIKSYENKITGWVSEKDGGYAEALLKGFDKATGDILCWINASDLFLPNAFNVARKIFEQMDADFIFGDDLYISENDSVISFSKGYIINLRSAMLYGGWTPLQDACFWRRELYNSVDGINANLKYAADFDLFLRFAIAGKSIYVPRVFSAFRKHERQKSIANNREYNAERKKCMKHAMHTDNTVWFKKICLKIFYWFYIRIRARIFHKLWDIKKYHGRPVGNFHCE